MNTSPEYNAAIDSELDAQAAFDATASDRDELPKDKLLTVNVDGPQFVARALGAARNISMIADQLAALPGFDDDIADRLEQLALAFSHAHTRHLSASKLPDDLATMLADGTATRDRFRADFGALAARGLLPHNALARCCWQPGFVNVAQDLALISNVFLANIKQLKRKSALDRDEIERAGKLATRMLRQSGSRTMEPRRVAETADTRARAFTLLVGCYDDVCRGVSYLRWRHGDAEQLAPSLYKRPRHSNKEPDAPAEPTPAEPVNNLSNPGGSPFIS